MPLRRFGRSIGVLFLTGMVWVFAGLACQRGGIPQPTQVVPGTAFSPGLVATQLARPPLSGTAAEVAPQATPLEPIPAPPSGLSATPASVSSSDRDQYTLAARLDLDQHRLDVRQAVTVTNRTGESWEEIWLVVDADRQAGVFELGAFTWGGAGLAPVKNTPGIWQVKLPSAVQPGMAGVLEIAYQLNLQAAGGVLGYSRRQVNLGDWYVRVPPYQPGVGWLVHEPGTAGENAVYETADFKVQLDLGAASHSLTVAASAPAIPCGDTLCFEMANSRGFAWSASPEYQVFEVDVDGILLQQYVFPEHAAAGQAALEAGRQAVRLFQDTFGPYPYPSLAMVEGGFFDGMEYPAFFFLGEDYYTYYDGTPKGYLTALTVHEIAHQWWFAVVGNDQAVEPWLDEALATYSELLYYQEQYPDLVDWWWDFRVGRFQPGGRVDSTIYDTGGFRPYVNAVYLRGAQFLQELRLAMGGEAFQAFLQAYYAAYRGKIATAEGFFSLAGEFIEQDQLERIRQPYFSP